jgi:hypothetical protein
MPEPASPDFAVTVTEGRHAVAAGAENDEFAWTTYHAVGGMLVTETPRAASVGLIRVLLALWPILANGAIEVRWLAAGGQVKCAILVRASADDTDVARGECEKRLEAAFDIASSLMHGWGLQPLGVDSLRDTLAPFDVVEGGDLLRREIDVALSSGDEADVPLLVGANPQELDLLVAMLADSEAPVVVSLAAAPTAIDEAERSVLHAELVALERTLVGAAQSERDERDVDAETPTARLAAAAQILQRRIGATERVGFLRLSLASAAPMSLALLASAQEALAATPVALEWIPAAEPSEREVFSANLETLGFTPWGVQAEEQPGHETVNDCYLASLEEILSELIVPAADGFLPLAHQMVDPVPRPVHKAVPHEGRVVGVSLDDPRRRVALSEADRTRHAYVVGQTGTGKSTLLLNLALQDIEAGLGTCVIDPHGDLVDAILERFPQERVDDVVLFDPGDTQRFIGLNPLEASGPIERDFVVQQLIGMLYRIYDPGHTGIIGPRFEHWFRNAALTVMAHPDGGVLLDIPRVFTNDRFLAERLQYVSDPVVRSFWIDEMGQIADFHKSEILGWFTSKFGAFNTNAAMRGILSQRQSTISITDVMDNGQVLLVKLPRGALGEINAMWLGMILISKIQMAALGRTDRPISERMLFNLYVDEFQNFAYTDFDALIAEARKYGLALTLAHQHVAQLSDAIRSAVFGNISTWMLFRMGLADAELLEDDLEGFSARDLSRLPNRRCIVRTTIDGSPVPPFDIATLAPDTREPNRERADSLIALSSLKYGRSAAIVEAEYRSEWTGNGKARAANAESAESAPVADAGTGQPSAEAAERLMQLEDAWHAARQSAEIGDIFNAARELAEALVAAGRTDDALGVLEEALECVGSGPGHPALRRALVRDIARFGAAEHPRRVGLALARCLFVADDAQAEQGWAFVSTILSELDPAADVRTFSNLFSHMEELAARPTRPTWDELDADPVFKP